MEEIKNSKSFLVLGLSSFILLFLMLFIGINSSTKGTSAANETGTCPSDYESIYFNDFYAIGSGSRDAIGYYCCPKDVSEATTEEQLHNQYEILYVNGKMYCFDTRTAVKDKTTNKFVNTIFKSNASVDDDSKNIGCQVSLSLGDVTATHTKEEGDKHCKNRYGSNWQYGHYVSPWSFTCETSFKNCSVPAKNTVENAKIYTATFYDYAGNQSGDVLSCEVSPGFTSCKIDKNIFSDSTGWGTTKGCTKGTKDIEISSNTKFYACYDQLDKKECYRNDLLNIHIWASREEILNERFVNNNNIWHDTTRFDDTEEKCLDNNVNGMWVSCQARNSSTGEVISDKACSSIEQLTCNYEVTLKGAVNDNKCSVTTPAAPNVEGYKFEGWGDYQCKNLLQVGASKEINGNGTSLYPCYSVKTTEEVAVTFHYYDGMENQVWEREKGFKIDFDDISYIVRLGYTFDGWYTAATGGTKMTGEYIVEKDVHFYSRWTPYILKYKFVADAGDGKVVLVDALPDDSKTYSLGDTFSEGDDKTGFYLPKLVAEYNNNLFKGWYTQKNCKGELFETGTDVNVLRYEQGIQIEGNKNVSYKVEDATAIITIYACYESDGNQVENPSTQKGVNIITDAGDGYISFVSGVSDLGSGKKTYTQTCFVYDDRPECNVIGEVKASLDGYTFTGWGTTKGCTSGKSISEYFASESTTYYACYQSVENEVETPDGNIDEAPVTGDISIFIISVIGLAAIVFTIWYYKKIKLSNN